jgi:prepilin-type N-terminal cleavage/methylation domain-containing protein
MPVHSQQLGGKKGFTLIELMVIISIISILAGLGMYYYRDWQKRYTLEGGVKQLYIDLMNTRVRAMERNRMHFVNLSAGGYSVYEDTNTPPDGNGTLDTGTPADTQLQSTTFSALLSSVTVTASGGSRIDLSTRGLATNNHTICFFSNLSPGYDCIVISPTRILTGRIMNQGGACNADNCRKQ